MIKFLLPSKSERGNMFETKIEDEGITERIRSWFGDKFFPVNIAKRKDYLIIEDKRIRGNILLPSLAVIAILAVVSFIFPWVVSSIWEFLALIAAAIVIVFFLLVLISSFVRRTIVFYKDKDTYEIINHGLFKTHRETGDISDIKEIKIIIRRSENSDGDESYTFTSQIVPKRVILDDLRVQDLEKETIFNSYETTTRIVFAVTDFLNIPYSEDEIG